jgi:hypothetical protein
MDNYVIGGRWWGTSLCLVGWQSIFFDLEHLDSAKKNDQTWNQDEQVLV